MVGILIIAVMVEMAVINYLFNERNYWKQVSKYQKEIMNKWWREEM